ncbi:DUF1593 domain-containing protein [Arcicella aquatica]|uniref:DUF1593 domain-containing protein n=1 Tax=Arcicella aquatica TaxID=217141 RepID=A0ABU5QQN9_9BACT|nr:DUF1593 domain-containing protein [Arcicella aquatica]MEA5259403.1 DUF1593 domain-containing protein [Arcicella aquatica]
MKIYITLLLVIVGIWDGFSQPRVVIMSDFPPVDVIPGGMGFGVPEKRSDSDDLQSMVRFLLYANEFKVEGIVATSATFANVANKQHIFDMLYLYDYVYNNLHKKDSRYPTAKQLRAVTWQGLSGTYGRPASEVIGKGRESEASEQLIKLLEKDDDTPIWFCIWGGSSDLSQALWTIKQTKNASDLRKIIKKIRIYMIGLQDGSGQWLLDTFPALFIIMSSRNYMGMFNNAQGADIKLSDLNWINKHIRKGHGLLGAIYPESGFYPETPGVWEGDSPSFLYLVSAIKGINNPEKPNQDSWGGKFIQIDSTKNHWFDDPAGTESVWKWRSQVQQDFATRATWMLP